MNEPVGTSIPEAPKKNNTVLIVVIVVVVLCCCCAVVGGIAWQFGDQIVQALGF
jgi:flagellar basal body-associated protein FliL